MERRLPLSTIAAALVLGTATASGQTPRPSERDRNVNPPQSTQAPPAQPRTNPQPGADAQNPRAPVRAPQNGAGQVQQGPTQPNQTQGPAQPGQTQPGMTQGQAQPGNATGGANANNGAANGNAAQNPNGAQNANANRQGNPQGVITLNERQNTRVAQAIHQANVRPLANVTFSIAVGTEVPASVELHVLPPALAEVVPQYRDDRFVVVEQEALIIDPGTHTIVAVVPFEAQQTTGAAAPPPPAPARAAAPPSPEEAAAPPRREHKKNELTRDQREVPHRQAQRHHKTDTDKHVTIERRTTTGAGPREPRVGDRVPDDAVIERRPVEVYPDRPPLREERPRPGLRDIPLIGPLFGPPRDED